MEKEINFKKPENFSLYAKYFLTYCILGCVFEFLFILSVTGEFVKSGFLIGPFIPIYGVSVVVTTIIYKAICKPKEIDNSKSKVLRLTIFCLITLVGVALIEFIAGNLFELLFGVVIWDHSESFGFVPGGKYVNLLITPLLGIALIIMVLFVNKYVEKIMFKIPEIVFKVLMILFALDVVISIVLQTI